MSHRAERHHQWQLARETEETETWSVAVVGGRKTIPEHMTPILSHTSGRKKVLKSPLPNFRTARETSSSSSASASSSSSNFFPANQFNSIRFSRRAKTRRVAHPGYSTHFGVNTRHPDEEDSQLCSSPPPLGGSCRRTRTSTIKKQKMFNLLWDRDLFLLLGLSLHVGGLWPVVGRHQVRPAACEIRMLADGHGK